MCGIVGICNVDAAPVCETTLRRMVDILQHRGPDGQGCFIDGCIGFGHRRLSIIDLTAAGSQPIANEDDNVVAIYNGEIYNFRELRRELEARGHDFRSRTDSEVVVHAFEQWGEKCLDRFNGMFAFAIYDRRERRLFLARDRYGVKPLYWYFDGRTFLFASEIKAILLHPAVSRRVSYPALNEYFSFQNIFSDLTLFEGIRLLPPGHCIGLTATAGATPAVRQYWDVSWHAHQHQKNETEWADELDQLFRQAVERQLVSDVPVGSYLSGGMDSGAIAAVAARHVPRLCTFTAGFDVTSVSGLELGYDERRHAEVLANQLKTEHYEVVLHAGDMEWILPDLVWNLEDLRVGQCYPNSYVARLAGKFVKVVLSGAGGDELFGGYPWRYYRGLNSANGDDYLRRYYAFWQRLVPDEERRRLYNDTTCRAVAGHSPYDVFCSVFERWDGPLETNEDFIDASLYFEFKTFLHGLLVVEDKLSMAHSLETRLPFLDNDLVEFAWRLPASMKLKSLGASKAIDENQPGKRRLYELETNDGKLVFRRAMERLIPRAVTERAKQGFSAPDASWFRGESIDYINRLLRDPKALMYEFLAPAYVAHILDEHCSGAVNHRLLIWSFLSFEWWCRRFLDAPLAS
jgi:asparagine synthase (glutamine-hydrolysing)